MPLNRATINEFINVAGKWIESYEQDKSVVLFDGEERTKVYFGHRVIIKKNGKVKVKVNNVDVISCLSVDYEKRLSEEELFNWLSKFTKKMSTGLLVKNVLFTAITDRLLVVKEGIVLLDIPINGILGIIYYKDYKYKYISFVANRELGLEPKSIFF